MRLSVSAIGVIVFTLLMERFVVQRLRSPAKRSFLLSTPTFAEFFETGGIGMRLIKGSKVRCDVLECEKQGIKLEAWKYPDLVVLEMAGKQFQLTKREAIKLGKFISEIPK